MRCMINVDLKNNVWVCNLIKYALSFSDVSAQKSTLKSAASANVSAQLGAAVRQYIWLWCDLFALIYTHDHSVKWKHAVRLLCNTAATVRAICLMRYKNRGVQYTCPHNMCLLSQTKEIHAADRWRAFLCWLAWSTAGAAKKYACMCLTPWKVTFQREKPKCCNCVDPEWRTSLGLHNSVVHAQR